VVISHGFGKFLKGHILKFCKVQDELIDWRNESFESKSFITPPNTNAIHFDTTVRTNV